MELKYIFMLVALFMFSGSGYGANSVVLPEADWKLYVPEQSSICKGSGKGFEIKGDFNGNGKTDIARLQISQKEKKARVAVWFDGKLEPTVIVEEDMEKMGNYLHLVSPGKFKPFCEEDNCSGDAFKEVNVKTQALAYGTCESSKVIYYWDKVASKFSEVWVSD